METRLYFMIGDLVSNVLAGALVGLACSGLVSASWNMLLAMVVGMVVGMILTLPIQIMCSLLFGAFEVMLPMMLTGMTAGMIVAMTAAMRSLSAPEAALGGIGTGVAVLVFTYGLNAYLGGEVRRWTT